MAYAEDRKIRNNVTGVRWVASSTGMLHSVPVTEGMLKIKEGGEIVWLVDSVKAECGQTFGPRADGSKRCTKCVKIAAPHVERKTSRTAHLVERRPDAMETGLRGGDTRAAEARRTAEAEKLRLAAAGKRVRTPKARIARIDGEVRQIAPAPVLIPHASTTPTGIGAQRADGTRVGTASHSDGPAMYKGAAITGSSQPRMWRNPKTGELERSSRGTMADTVPPHPHADVDVVGRRETVVPNKGINGGSTRTQRRRAQRKRFNKTLRAMAVSKAGK